MRRMPHRTLRFCPRCVVVEHPAGRAACGACGTRLLPLMDEHGALSGAFLVARGFCCGSGCRNCPYSAEEGASSKEAATAQSKSCARCGRGLCCQPANCWCEAVTLSPATLKWLQRTYSDCLCPSCLAGLTGS